MKMSISLKLLQAITQLTWEGLQALSSHNVPHLNSRVCIARDKDVVS